MKKLLSVVLAMLCVVGMAFSFASCDKDAKSDWEKVKEQGYFTCGITVYAPMNYYDDDNKLVGFDTEFAKAVAKELGVEVKFTVIDWGSKYVELESGNIDCIWNGFTYGMESDGVSRTEYVDFTYSYLENRQCIVTTKENLEKYNVKGSFEGLKGAAEAGSSGQGVAESLSGNKELITTFDSQSAALLELKSGTVDFAVIDYQMAVAMVGKGDYASLSINNAFQPESEVYAIGCRKGSDLTAKINEAIAKLSADGTLDKIAAKYKLTNDLIPNIGAKDSDESSAASK